MKFQTVKYSWVIIFSTLSSVVWSQDGFDSMKDVDGIPFNHSAPPLKPDPSLVFFDIISINGEVDDGLNELAVVVL